MDGIVKDLFWFSHLTTEYEVYNEGIRKKFVLREESPQIKLDWDNCSLDVASLSQDGKVRFIIRSHTNRNSEYMGNIPVQLRFMFSLDIDSSEISELRYEENYHLMHSKRKNLPTSARNTIHSRWVFNLGEAEVWEWTKPELEMRSSRLWRLREEIRKSLDGLKLQANLEIETNIIRLDTEKLEEVIPVIYQPAVDSLNNFLRELHCARITNKDGSIDVEVTLLFNNEQLRKFKLADGFYRWLRKLLYGRMIDIETFRIHFVKDNEDKRYLMFEGIYSGDYDLEYDTIHLDKPPNVQHRNILYNLDDYYHPVIFVNTSNHAMAEHDNNLNLWKWEYVAWLENAPIVLGSKSRKEIDRQFKPFFSRIFSARA